MSEQEYDWELIPQVLLQSDHEDKIQMTSTLVMHVARACKIQPKPGTVGTGLDDAITALVENFYYDRNIAKLSIYDEELCYTYREIMDISRSELNLRQPIYVSIKGHAITCNGYDQDNNKFLCNWGWGQADRWTTLDKNGCDPMYLVIGIRPAEDDVIFLNNYSSDFEGRFYNYKGMVSFSVSNKAGLQKSLFRVVLYDDAGVRRNIISDVFEYDFINKNNNISIPVSLPSNITFGQRNVCVEYKAKYGFRPLRFPGDEINLHLITTEKTISNVTIVNDVIIPPVLKEDDAFNVSIYIENKHAERGYIAAVLSDKKLNNLYVLGFSELKTDHNNVEINCVLSEVFSERNYELIFVYSQNAEFSDAQSSLIKLNDGAESINVYVRNKDSSYLPNIQLTSVSGIDLSNPLNDYQPYKFNISTNVTYLTEVSGVVVIEVTNANDDLINR